MAFTFWLCAVVLVAATSGASAKFECPAGEVGLYPHPEACQRYYHCSGFSRPWKMRYLEDNEDECAYPEVFDVTTRSCRSYSQADCGHGRVAAKDPCEYVKNKCGSAHCQPCSSRLPSCVGLADGIHEHPMKLNSPYYIVCENERLVEVKFCDLDEEEGKLRLRFFSPGLQSCVTFS